MLYITTAEIIKCGKKETKMPIEVLVVCPACAKKVNGLFNHLNHQIIVKHNPCPPFVAQLVKTKSTTYTLHEVKTMNVSLLDEETT